MKRLVLLCLLGSLAWAVPPLLVTAVERKGLPPYEGTERDYRLEGVGCQTLRVGEVLVLQRSGEVRRLGRLEILSVHQDHALAKLTVAGETYPLKGDLAVRTELFVPLPALPAVALPEPLPTATAVQPNTITRAFPRPVSPDATRREAIFFLKGDASLSPGGAAKLSAWAETWGLQGHWSLECPQEPGTLSTVLLERTATLRAELLKRGVSEVETKALPPEPPGRYDAVYVVKEPW